ncbi:4Fe-4S binding protein, partial [candidate division WOR-3 bacterium]|nr:4Fe-4S binding protein [candidate division WOR-3 bacterium]
LFHLGRMTHMSLSCVGCGACEDACPMSIDVSQIFNFVADDSQELFNYVPGKSVEELLPLKTYKEDELHEVEI